jgi:hypothetical protein
VEVPRRRLFALVPPSEVAAMVQSAINTFIIEPLRDDAGGVPSLKSALSLVLVFNGTDTPVLDAIDSVIARAFAFVRRPVAAAQFSAPESAEAVFDFVTESVPAGIEAALNCTYDPITAPDEPWNYGCLLRRGYHAPRRVRLRSEIGGVALAESHLPWPLACSAPTPFCAVLSPGDYCCDAGFRPCEMGTYDTCASIGFEDGFDTLAYALEWLFPRAITRARAIHTALLGSVSEWSGIPNAALGSRIIEGTLARFDVPGGLPSDPATVFCFWWTAALLPLYTVLAFLLVLALAFYTAALVLAIPSIAVVALGVIHWPSDVALVVNSAVTRRESAQLARRARSMRLP